MDDTNCPYCDTPWTSPWRCVDCIAKSCSHCDMASYLEEQEDGTIIRVKGHTPECGV